MTLPGWTREPLVHFLVAGTLLYAFFAWSGGNVPDPASRVIEIGAEEQQQIALRFERTMGRAPTDAEFDALIDRFVRDEVLYREALRMGLDQGDAVVRQRLVAKMDMAASAAAEAAQPTEEQLQQWLAAHPERFAAMARFTFDQIYSPDQAGALALLTAKGGPGANWQAAGEPISLPATAANMPASEVAGRFGEQFLAAIAALERSDQWAGPIQSGFGWHLVRLRAIERSDVPPLAEIRAEVENDWRSAEIAARKQRAFQILRDAYRVEIDR